MSVDVVEGATVTFDSYESEEGKRESVYGDSHLGKSITIQYNEGIDIKHIIASSSIPEVYAYEEINGHKFWDGGLISNTPIKELVEAHQRYWKKRIGSKNLEDSLPMKLKSMEREEGQDNCSKESRYQHQVQRIPNLEIYIVNLLDPRQNNNNYNNSVENMVPQDFDGVKGRHIDI
ncbi:MAG: hypothetical protein M3Y25_09085, partial [Thermoproteota archaeon]|nr:hypothetical protein [Thermoproteota archaeon]